MPWKAYLGVRDSLGVARSIVLAMATLNSVLLFWVCSLAVAVEVRKEVLEDGGKGTAAVLLSVAHIQQAAIFPDDNEMLRRIAYVETRDGLDSNTYIEGNYGGIWAVSETAFESTKDSNNTLLALKHEQLLQQFGVEWQHVHLSELRKPFYSALAARLVLFIAPWVIPSRRDVVAQAQFWREYYTHDGSVEDFIGAASALQGK